MFKINQEDFSIKMNEKDFGLIIKIKLSNVSDKSSFKIKIYNYENEEILTKDLIAVDNILSFKLSKEESSLLKTGDYLWGLIQYVDNELYATLLVDKIFLVEKGA